MKVKELKKVLEKVDEDIEVFIQSDISNICGNIVELDSVDLTVYGFLGVSMPCIILDAKDYKCSKRRRDSNTKELVEVKE